MSDMNRREFLQKTAQLPTLAKFFDKQFIASLGERAQVLEEQLNIAENADFATAAEFKDKILETSQKVVRSVLEGDFSAARVAHEALGFFMRRYVRKFPAAAKAGIRASSGAIWEIKLVEGRSPEDLKIMFGDKGPNKEPEYYDGVYEGTLQGVERLFAYFGKLITGMEKGEEMIEIVQEYDYKLLSPQYIKAHQARQNRHAARNKEDASPENNNPQKEQPKQHEMQKAQTKLNNDIALKADTTWHQYSDLSPQAWVDNIAGEVPDKDTHER